MAGLPDCRTPPREHGRWAGVRGPAGVQRSKAGHHESKKRMSRPQAKEAQKPRHPLSTRAAQEMRRQRQSMRLRRWRHNDRKPWLGLNHIRDKRSARHPLIIKAPLPDRIPPLGHEYPTSSLHSRRTRPAGSGPRTRNCLSVQIGQTVVPFPESRLGKGAVAKW